VAGDVQLTDFSPQVSIMLNCDVVAGTQEYCGDICAQCGRRSAMCRRLPTTVEGVFMFSSCCTMQAWWVIEHVLVPYVFKGLMNIEPFPAEYTRY
jgi:hypothetical protein